MVSSTVRLPDNWKRRRFACRQLQRRRSPNHTSAFAAFCAFALLLALLTACDSGATPQVKTTATPSTVSSPTTQPFTFPDWRVAYQGQDGRLHAVSVDGRFDIAGATLPNLSQNGYGVSSAGNSPDGHRLAYSGWNTLEVRDAEGYPATRQPSGLSSREMFWSPDGSELALGSGAGSIGIVTISGLKLRPVPDDNRGIWNVLGWIDATHLAVTVFPPDQNSDIPRVTLATLDTTSWVLHTVITISSATQGEWHLSLSPDGKHALYFNARFRDDPYIPTVSEIELATGRITPLPQLVRAMGPYSGFTSIAWNADNKTLAASSGFDSNGDLQTWLLDTQHDTATQLKLPTARYIAGWTPGNGPLVLSSGWQSTIGLGPYTISAVAIGTGGQATETVLTRTAMTFPYLGFVHPA